MTEWKVNEKLIQLYSLNWNKWMLVSAVKSNKNNVSWIVEMKEK